ncbi:MULTISPECIES: HpcH/HpaI aldolase family protein [Maribacter]|uniref:2,4-dihydroxyhept-2-ene-1,7-dioic acid aldolase n=2 Tax=Maribacter TaxID=252356 RepID=A0A5B2TYR3_9FLAO|nr:MULTISPECIES: aldolase/citrate lyase family protein [Maribacter]KAA2219253.1 2,4-dihydroxyhept-2-ene-1,7-dioic acid aldolase [Maribacter flavus]MDC6404187.1 aldolase/citrate lyase family protein [Maribacter sp. PR66]MEE1971330.1 aldolase/citrate lyase family protein [Maribacter flavus]TLF46481.1 2,4-dihydroxyhept-2-ene-1,7-dioic acid aldolase [Maribacter aurantiacus]
MKNFLHTKSNLKEKLKKRQVSFGSWLTIPHPSIVEIMSSAGFEWLTIDIEHSAIDISTLQNLVAHVQANKMEALVRVSKNEEVIIKRVMDAGANGVIVPMVKNAEEARQAVSWVKYPPLGSRGVGLSRAQHYGLAFNEYNKWVQEEAVVIAQIEHIEGVNNLSEILDVEGIDGIIVGPYDLSASMGKPGMFYDDDVKEVLARIDKITLEKSRSLGFHVIESDYKKVMDKIKMQYNFLAFSLDFFFLGDKAREQMDLLRDKL